MLNVIVTEAQAPGYLTVYPCGSPVPTASSLNYSTGSTVANLVVTKIGADGSVCLFTQSGAHLLADVNGYFPVSTTYQPLLPARLLETRSGEPTIDGLFIGAGLRPSGTVTELAITNRGGLPAAVATVMLNVTVTGSTAPGFVTVYPCGIPRPLASNLNYDIGTTAANAALVKVAANGTVCLFNSGATHLVVDVNGYLPA